DGRHCPARLSGTATRNRSRALQPRRRSEGASCRPCSARRSWPPPFAWEVAAREIIPAPLAAAKAERVVGRDPGMIAGTDLCTRPVARAVGVLPGGWLLEAIQQVERDRRRRDDDQELSGTDRVHDQPPP